MEELLDPGLDRVRANTPPQVNEDIDLKTRENILWYSREDPDVIVARMAELDKEWDMERTLILNASLLSLFSLIMGYTRNRTWLVAPAVISFFLAQHAIQGWCPPVEVFRRMGVRTRKEIDMEKYALMEALKARQV
jgi:hypothetical protein